ncbi:MAG: phage terminase large subunit family protein [Quinella sp. 1Q5]|nr:phage terminase large subunit family protein [Quinella sp. 1Q5]
MKNVKELKKIIRGALKPPSRETVSAWADEFAMLPSTSAEPGHYRTSRVPYFKEVMDAFNDNRVRRVVVKSASQVGKSSVLLNVLGRYAHLAPCPCMIIQPTLSDAMDFSKRRLSPFIRDTKVITKLFYDKEKTRDANQTILSKYFKGGSVVLVGANSPSGLASRPIKILLCDEVDRYPPSAGKEGSPIGLAEKRMSTYWDGKLGIFSTPTVKDASTIDIEYELGTQEEWRHKCPSCGSWELLSVENMISDYVERRKKTGARTILIKSVKWSCPTCGEIFDEVKMRNAAQGYVAQNPDALANGVRSFFINGFVSPWVSWQDILKEWLTVQGDPLREMNVYNTRFGLSYELPVELEEIKQDNLEDYPAAIPDEVLIVTAGVDVQKDRLEYAVYGWNAVGGYGIERGKVYGLPQDKTTWAELDALLNRTYTNSAGKQFRIARTFVDSGFMTDYVYAYCRSRLREGRFAIKGRSAYGSPLIIKTGIIREAGVYLVVLNVDSAKDEVVTALQSGKIHFGRDDQFLTRSFDEEFFKQLSSERKVKKVNGAEVWKKRNQHARNEALDVTVYALAAIKSCITSEDFWTNLAEEKPPSRRRIVSRELET